MLRESNRRRLDAMYLLVGCEFPAEELDEQRSYGSIRSWVLICGSSARFARASQHFMQKILAGKLTIMDLSINLGFHTSSHLETSSVLQNP